MFPKEINEIVKNMNYDKDLIGCSDDSIYLFEDRYVLKVCDNKERIQHEKEMIDWLYSNKIQDVKSIAFVFENDKYFYLRTLLKGESLIESRILNNPLKLIEIIGRVFDILKQLDRLDCPYLSVGSKGVEFVHGDLCLPNIYVDKDDNFVGFIDVGNSGLGDRFYDIAWILWSLENNLKTDKYNELLLNRIGYKFDDEKYNMFIDDECKEMILKK